ncbi:PEPxxWA-CTERM sorting domain-containing protein [Phenylobacterium sp.]|uniref:PEPxxWA-CTERM sorting domain-containing protein n=1 Tax=Phenylobacterium sp. TaxID=1871053 RepID=UPI0025F6936D|nr:PEPxxWA-CTERM sorting domain-containing protein [Phenylobacterium sp.]
MSRIENARATAHTPGPTGIVGLKERGSASKNAHQASATRGRAYEFPAGEEPSLIFFTPLSGYEVSFSDFSWTKGAATSSARFYFEVVDTAGNQLFRAGNSIATYTVDTAYFTGPLTFRFSNGGQGGVAIDRIALDVRAVQVQPPPGGVPEPGTWALMILGFGGAGATPRRRRIALA